MRARGDLLFDLPAQGRGETVEKRLRTMPELPDGDGGGFQAGEPGGEFFPGLRPGLLGFLPRDALPKALQPGIDLFGRPPRSRRRPPHPVAQSLPARRSGGGGGRRQSPPTIDLDHLRQSLHHHLDGRETRVRLARHRARRDFPRGDPCLPLVQTPSKVIQTRLPVGIGAPRRARPLGVLIVGAGQPLPARTDTKQAVVVEDLTMKPVLPRPPSPTALPQPVFCQSTALPFLQSLPSGSVDLVLTDPPYLISRESGFANVVNGETRLGVRTHFGEWDTETVFSMADLAAAVAESYRVLRKGGTAIFFFDVWKITPLREMLEQAGFKTIRLIQWVKTNPVPLNSKRCTLSNAIEIALVAVKGGNGTFQLRIRQRGCCSRRSVATRGGSIRPRSRSRSWPR